MKPSFPPERYLATAEPFQLGPNLILYRRPEDMPFRKDAHGGHPTSKHTFASRKNGGRTISCSSDEDYVICQVAEIHPTIRAYKKQTCLFLVRGLNGGSYHVVSEVTAETRSGAPAWLAGPSSAYRQPHTPEEISIIRNAFRQAGAIYFSLEGNDHKAANIQRNTRIIFGCRDDEVLPSQSARILDHVRTKPATIGTCGLQLSGCATPNRPIYALMAQGHLEVALEHRLSKATPVFPPDHQPMMRDDHV